MIAVLEGSIASILGENERFEKLRKFSEVYLDSPINEDSIQKKIWLNLIEYAEKIHEYKVGDKTLEYYDVRSLFKEIPELLELWILINKKSCLYGDSSYSLMRFTKYELEYILNIFIPTIVIEKDRGKFHGRAFLYHKDYHIAYNLYYSHLLKHYKSIGIDIKYPFHFNSIYIEKNYEISEDMHKIELLNEIRNIYKTVGMINDNICKCCFEEFEDDYMVKVGYEYICQECYYDVYSD